MGLDSIDPTINRLRRVTNWLIYASVVLGIALLWQLYDLIVPPSLFYSILAGWALYLAVAIALATGHYKAYPAALFLSILTLIVSLPQPEHYSLADAGTTVASLTFIIGSVLQAGLIILLSSMILKSRQSRLRGVSPQRQRTRAHSTESIKVNPTSDSHVFIASEGRNPDSSP